MTILSDILFYTSNKVIFVKSPRTIVSIQDLIDTIRDWEVNSPIATTIPTLFTAGGKERLDATNQVGITMTLWGWTIQFEARLGPSWVLCEVNGGNLVAQSNTFDNQIGSVDVNPFTPSAYVQVTYAKSAAPTLTTTSTSGVGTPTEVADAVWSATAAAYNSAGTTGAKLNSAGAAGDPWATDLSGYTSGTAGNVVNNIVSNVISGVRTDLTTELTHLMALQNGLTSNQATLLTEIYQLYGLDPTKPLVVTKTSRVAGTINQSISGDSNSTTVTRV